MDSTRPLDFDECHRLNDSDPSFSSGVQGSSLPHTLYVPIASPPTPAPSPRPLSFTTPSSSFPHNFSSHDPAHFSRREFNSLAALNPSVRRQYLASLLGDCTPSELLFISTTIAPLLKRDFLKELPPEIGLHILSFVNDPKTLARVGQVSRRWRTLVEDEWIWKRMCDGFHFDDPDPACEDRANVNGDDEEPLKEMEQFATIPMDLALEWLISKKRLARKEQKLKARSSDTTATASTQDLALQSPVLMDPKFSYRAHFKHSYSTMMNWRRGGHLLQAHRVPVTNPESGVVTSVALDADWVVVGLANCRIHVFSARTGVLSRTLIGHELGVWAVHLVSKGGSIGTSSGEIGRGKRARTRKRRSENRDDTGDTSLGVGGLSIDESAEGLPIIQPSLDHLVPPSLRSALGLDLKPTSMLSEESDEVYEGQVPKMDVGKRSDVCCASEGWGQPNSFVVSGGCDKVLRVWDVKTGYCIYVLHGHTSTIRCIRVLHNRPVAVTGSRDSTLRVWDVQRGRTLRVLQGHQQSVRCLDVCGNKVVSGSYDTTCRLWDVDTGECSHVLRGHIHQIYSVAYDGNRIASGGLDTTVRVWDAASGVCLALLQGHTALVCQLQLSPTILATGGSDGRVITFSLSTFAALQRITAHDSSVTSLQFDKHFLVTGGNDGRVRLFETLSGNYVRELTEPCESVWKAVYKKDTCAIMCKRAGKTVTEIWSYKPGWEG